MNPYDTYGWQDETNSLQWLATDSHIRLFSTAGPFTNDTDAAQQLATRRKAMVGYEVTLIRDGVEWEPTT